MSEGNEAAELAAAENNDGNISNNNNDDNVASTDNEGNVQIAPEVPTPMMQQHPPPVAEQTGQNSIRLTFSRHPRPQPQPTGEDTAAAAAADEQPAVTGIPTAPVPPLGHSNGNSNNNLRQRRSVTIPLRMGNGQPIRVGPGSSLRFNIPVPPATAMAFARHQQQQINMNGTANGNRNINPPINPQHRHVHLARLQPQLLPEAQQEWNDLESSINGNGNDATAAATSTTDDNATDADKKEGSDADDKYNAFKCAVCYEIMDEPVGCGKCSARFCFSCLQRVAELSNLQHRQQQHVQQHRQQQQQQQPQQQQQQQQQQQAGNDSAINNNSPPLPRCPVCRSEMASPESLLRDTELKKRMDLALPIPCRFKGCPDRLKLTQIAAHEATACLHIKLQCRYQPFGCAWKGKRGDLSRHEENDCQLAKVSGLVDRLRQTQAECFHRMAHLNQNMNMHTSVIEMQRLREANQMSTSNYIQVCHYVHLLMCCTPRLLVTKDIWAPFYNNAKGRAAVSNFFTMLPTGILMLKTMAASYQQVLRSSLTPLETEEELLEMLDGTLYLLILACLGVILGLCFFADSGGPEQWQSLPIPLPRRWFPTPRNTHVLLYSAIFAVTAAQAFAFEFSVNAFHASLSWYFLCLASTLFPAMVLSMSEAVNSLPGLTHTNADTIKRVLTTGRATGPVWIGLRYSPCIVAVGIVPCIDAAVILYLGSKAVLKKLLWNLEDELLSRIPRPVLYAYAGVRLAVKAPNFADVNWIRGLDSLFVAVAIILVNLMMLILVKYGVLAGAGIVNQSRARVMNTSSPNMLRVDYHGAGIAAFGSLCLVLGAIATT